MKYLRHEMELPSLLRYAIWRFSGFRSSVNVRLKSGLQLELRPSPYGDLFCAQEIFINEVYRCPRPDSLPGVQSIVDVGSNIGLSCLYWARLCKFAGILAFEPHPLHIPILKRHIELNHLEGRVKLVEGAAGSCEGEAVLEDAGLCSSLVGHSCEVDGVRVRIFDLYQILANQKIDLMKVDVEGYEYPILQDDRIASLSPSTIVIEWHNTAAYPDGRSWCSSRLSELGYEVVEGNDHQRTTGILWGFR